MTKCTTKMSAFFVVFILFGFTQLVMPTSKDGFNLYKDLLRGKGEEEDDVAELIDDGRASKVSYFYRTPAQLGLNLRGGQVPADFGKRTNNHFKNYMLGKESQADEDVHKRGSGVLLRWALANRQNYDHEGRLPFSGVSRSTAYGEP